MSDIEKIATDRYRIRAHNQIMTLSAQDLRDLSDWVLMRIHELDKETEGEQPLVTKNPDESVTLRFQPPLPCTTQDCEHYATVGTALYDPRENGWVVFPICKSCASGLVRKYEGEAST